MRFCIFLEKKGMKSPHVVSICTETVAKALHNVELEIKYQAKEGRRFWPSCLRETQKRKYTKSRPTSPFAVILTEHRTNRFISRNGIWYLLNFQLNEDWQLHSDPSY
jgi:hypothetical protein